MAHLEHTARSRSLQVCIAALPYVSTVRLDLSAFELTATGRSAVVARTANTSYFELSVLSVEAVPSASTV